MVPSKTSPGSQAMGDIGNPNWVRGVFFNFYSTLNMTKGKQFLACLYNSALQSVADGELEHHRNDQTRQVTQGKERKAWLLARQKQ